MNDTNTTGFFSDGFRWLGVQLNGLVFWLLSLVYQIFFNVSEARIITSETLTTFYNNMQLVIGVVVIFKLAISIIKGIVEPDSFFGGKDSGSGIKIIKKVVVALVLITLVMPINIPLEQQNNSYTENVAQNGLLFGTLFDLQQRIIKNQTINKFITGIPNEHHSDITSSNKSLNKEAADEFSKEIARFFVKVNVVDEDLENATEDQRNWMCKDPQPVLDGLKIYDANNKATTPKQLIALAENPCNDNIIDSEYYAFAFSPILGLLFGCAFVYVFASFTIAVGVRAIKLAILRLIAPIPIIASIDPKGDTNDLMKNWIKNVTSTYLDLFVHVAIIYFSLFIVTTMFSDGLDIGQTTTGLVGTFTKISLALAVFLFAKDAPKYIKGLLGIKDEGTGWFGALGKSIGTAAGTIGGAASSIGVARSRNAALAKQQREAGQKVHRFRNFLSSVGAGVAGGAAAAKAGFTAKDHNVGAALKENQARVAAAQDASTLFGRMSSGFHGMTGGTTKAQQFAKNSEMLKNYGNLYGELETMAENKDYVKSAKDSLEYLKASGASENAIRDADKHYKRVKADAMGVISSGNEEVLKLDGFTPQQIRNISSIRGEMQTIRENAVDEKGNPVFGNYQPQTLTINNLSEQTVSQAAKELKGTKFAASDSRTGIEHSQEYKTAKANDNAAGVTTKKS